MDTYGLTKILPLIALFTLVLILFLTRTFFLLLGDLIPGRVVYGSEARLIHAARSERLSRYWASHPEVQDVNALTALINRRVDALRSSANSDALHAERRWEDKVGWASEGLNIVKVYVLLGVVLFIWTGGYRSWRGWARLLLVLLAVSLAGVLFVARQVYCWEQVAYVRAYALDLVCSEDRACSQPIAPETLKDYRLRVENADITWWHFEFVSSYPLQWFCQTFFERGGEGPAFDQGLVREADNINRTLPKMVNRDTRLDAVVAGPGNRFTYVSSLVNDAKEDLKEAALLSLKQATRSRIIAGYKSNPQMKVFQEHDVELHYQYKDKNGEFLFEVIVTPKDF